jgi:hypothetical protein
VSKNRVEENNINPKMTDKEKIGLLIAKKCADLALDCGVEEQEACLL